MRRLLATVKHIFLKIKGTSQKLIFGKQSDPELHEPFDAAPITIGAFARFWNIKDSRKAAAATEQLWMEPKNKTTEIGVRLGIAF